MPDTGTYADAVVNAQCSAVAALCNNGYLRIYGGLQPAAVEDAIVPAEQPLLAELRFAATAFGAPAAGSMTANALTADSSANASGDATWCRVFKSDGTTALFDGSCGLIEDEPNLILNTTAIVAGEPVSVSTLLFIVPKGL